MASGHVCRARSLTSINQPRSSGTNPVALALVANLNQPGGSVVGATNITN
jgi:hypothetical protein